jgi:hypothetical protein
LEAALDVRARSVVVVISDFLDPVASYRNMLLECLNRHHVVMIDTANWWEVQFPKPAGVLQGARYLSDLDSLHTEWRDAARRVEDGTQPRPLRADDIEDWNIRVAGWRRELKQIVSRFGAGWCASFQFNTPHEAVRLANLHLGLVGR